MGFSAYVRGLSHRDVEGLYAEVFGGSFSRSAVSRATAKLQAEFDAWRTRDLAAYALLEDDRAVLLHLGLGPRESTDAWVASSCTT